MTKLLLKRRVIELRRSGKSYGEIKDLVSVSKSSLSLWLRNIPLTSDQVGRIKSKKGQAVEKFRETMKLKRQKRLQDYYKEQSKIYLPMTERELYYAGLFLYWGEGNKASRNTVSISNTDPDVLKFSLLWMVRCLKIPKYVIKVALHLYQDMNIESELSYWSKELGIPRRCFNKPYIKKTLRTSIDQKGFGHGTCNLIVQNTVIKEKLLMLIRSIADYYSQKAIKI
jgi:hypothetical protein